MKSQQIEIPIGRIQTHAEKYLSTHADGPDTVLEKVLSHAINETVIQTIVEDFGPVLQRAVWAGLEDQVKELVKQDIDVNERAERGWTALLYASAQGYPRIVRLLLDAGANPDVGNVHRITPLMYGALYGNLGVCKLLLEHGANPDLQDARGSTALTVATFNGHTDIVDVLLQAGANTTLKDHDGMTALDIAHNHKQGKIAKLLRLTARRR